MDPGRNWTLGLEKLMAIEVPVPPLANQQDFDRLQAEVTTLKAPNKLPSEKSTPRYYLPRWSVCSTE
ncbi:hypothetical protein JKG47_19235 [Acidithiobacillus sp. MC6.1]|nr:hypothetical protein [Acidithiobacillus sp. MC6.1]